MCSQSWYINEFRTQLNLNCDKLSFTDLLASDFTLFARIKINTTLGIVCSGPGGTCETEGKKNMTFCFWCMSECPTSFLTSPKHKNSVWSSVTRSNRRNVILNFTAAVRVAAAGKWWVERLKLIEHSLDCLSWIQTAASWSVSLCSHHSVLSPVIQTHIIPLLLWTQVSWTSLQLHVSSSNMQNIQTCKPWFWWAQMYPCWCLWVQGEV